MADMRRAGGQALRVVAGRKCGVVEDEGERREATAPGAVGVAVADPRARLCALGLVVEAAHGCSCWR